MKRYPFLLGCLLASHAAAAAQDDGEALFLSDLPVVLSASRLVQSPFDAPAPVTIIDRETIRASGFTEVHDLLRLVPGFQVADWPKGAPHVLNHGMGDASFGRLQILVDGRSVYNPFNGRIDWQELPLRLTDIERVEVVRGPAPATYGANAFQGVVNIITRDPRTEDGFAAIVRRGNQDVAEYAAILNSGGGGDIDWRLSVSRREATNFEDKGTTGTSLEGIRRDVVNGKLEYRLGTEDTLHFQLGHTAARDRVAQSAISAYYPAHDRDSDNLFLQAMWKHAYAPGSEWTLQFYRHQRDETERFPSKGNLINSNGEPVEFIVDESVDTVRDDLEFQHTHRFSDSLDTLWGVGLRRDRVRSDLYLTGLDNEGGTQWQAFGNVAWRFAPGWLLNAGGMLEKHYYTDKLFSPRLALNHELTTNQALRLSAGRGWRAPTVMNARSRELLMAGDKVIDIGYWSFETPEPERMDFIELGYVARFPSLGLSLDTRLFRNEYDNYIDHRSGRMNPERTEITWRYTGLVEPIPPTVPEIAQLRNNPMSRRNHPIYAFYNIHGARVDGGDLTLDWRHPTFGRFLLGYANIRIRPTEDGNRDEQDLAESAPRHSGSLLWSKRLSDRLTLNVGHYRVGTMKWLNDGDIQPAYHRTDVKLGWRLGKSGSENEVALTAQNLGGDYSEFRDTYLIERRVFATLRLGWW